MKELDTGWNDAFEEYRDKGVKHNNKTRDAPDPKNNHSGVSGLFGLFALICFIGVFIMGFFGEYLLPDGSTWLLPGCFGLIFVFAGLAIATGARQPLALAFSLAGAIVSGVSALYGLGSEEMRGFVMGQVVPMLFLSVFIIAGLGMLIIPGVLAKKRAAAHPIEARAKAIKKEEHVWTDSDHHMHRGWRLTWVYYAGGQERVYKSNTTRSPEPREPGCEGVLYLSKDDPDDVFEKPTGFDVWVLRAIGAAFLLAGAAAMAVFAMAF